MASVRSGISITLITCVFYVVTWEAIYFYLMPDFMVKYSAYVIGKAHAAGASEAAVWAKKLELQKSTVAYNAFTFLEPVPVGLLVTLISAAVLRKMGDPAPTATSALPTSRKGEAQLIHIRSSDRHQWVTQLLGSVISANSNEPWRSQYGKWAYF